MVLNFILSLFFLSFLLFFFLLFFYLSDLTELDEMVIRLSMGGEEGGSGSFFFLINVLFMLWHEYAASQSRYDRST